MVHPRVLRPFCAQVSSAGPHEFLPCFLAMHVRMDGLVWLIADPAHCDSLTMVNGFLALVIAVLAQAVDLHAVVPKGGVTTFERKLSQIRHGETPLAVGRATSKDKLGRGLRGPRIKASPSVVGEFLFCPQFRTRRPLTLRPLGCLK
jgi:hypothetical protein